MLLVLGFGIRFYGRGQQRQFGASLLVLVVLVGFSGVWAYAAKMPISSLQFGIQFRGVEQFTSGAENFTEAVFNLTIHNPTNVDTPAFEIESFDIVVNGTRLVPGTYYFGGSLASNSYDGLYYMLAGETVRAHQTKIYSDLILYIYWNRIETEGGVPSTVLLALNQSRFSMTFSGLIVVRTSYISSAKLAHDIMRPELRPRLIIAATPFRVSFAYP
jgi:hypothetical protein